MTIYEVEPGKSYACKFKIITMLKEDGTLPRNPTLGETFAGPGEYESLGVIKKRDVENKCVELIDTKTYKTFVVGFDYIWDIDEAEFVDGE